MKIKRIFLFILPHLIFSLIACNKEESNPDMKQQIGNITVNLLGIQENTEILQLNANASTLQQNKNEVSESLVHSEGFDVFTSITTLSNNAINKQAATQPTNITVSPLTKDRHYRILIYNEDFTQQIKDIEAISGINPNITLPIGKKYKWIAYTHNSTNVVKVENEDKILRSNVAKKDLSVASGEITPTLEGPNIMNIQFKKQTTRYAVVLDTRGLFGNMSTSNLSVELGTVDANNTFSDDVVQYGDFLVKSANPSYINLSNYPSKTTFVAGTQSSDFGYAMITFTIYSAPVNPPANKKLAIRVNGLMINHFDGNKTKTYPSSIIIPFNNSENKAVSKGVQYGLNATFIESGIKIGNTIWANTNLYYTETGKLNYNFRYDNSYTTPLNEELWYPGSNVPNKLTGDTFVSACALVYPKDKWKEPTKADYNTLADYPLKQSTNEYTVWNAYKNGTNEQDGTVELRFNHLGYYSNDSKLIGSNEGHYWQFNIENGRNGLFKLTSSTMSYDSRESILERRSIRCVRK